MTATPDFTILGERVPASGTIKEVWVEVGDTADDTDTLTVDLSEYGGGSAPQLLGVLGWIQTTTGSVVAQEQPTTAVSGSTVTLTIGGSTDNKKRAYVLYYVAKSAE